MASIRFTDQNKYVLLFAHQGGVSANVNSQRTSYSYTVLSLELVSELSCTGVLYVMRCILTRFTVVALTETNSVVLVHLLNLVFG